MKAALDIELSVRDYLNEGGKALVSGKYALYAQSANGAYFYNPNAPAEPECTDPDDLGVPAGAERLPAVLAGGLHLHRRWRHRPPTAAPIHWTGSPTRTPGGTADPRRQPGPHRVVPADVELPAAGGVPVVRTELGSGRLGPPGRRAVRAAHRRLASVQRAGRRVVQAADPHGRPHRCHHRAASVLHLLRDGGRLGLPVRRGARGRHRRRGPRCRTPTVTPATTPASAARRVGTSCTRSSTTTRPSTRPGTARRPAPPASWNAATGASAGSEEWAVDLSAYAGQQVELSISYVSDWGTQGIGVFLDDVSVTVGGATVAETSFETDLGGWTVAGPPEGSAPNPNDWARSQLAYEEGAVTATEDTDLHRLRARGALGGGAGRLRHPLDATPARWRIGRQPGSRSRQPAVAGSLCARRHVTANGCLAWC